MSQSRTLGRRGEVYAAEYLEKKGYYILAKNYRTRFGEIDIIAENASILAFIEVKTRTSQRFAQACEAVTTEKQRKIIAAAQSWLICYPTKLQPRFDVIELIWSNDKEIPYKVQHMENAFEV